MRIDSLDWITRISQTLLALNIIECDRTNESSIPSTFLGFSKRHGPTRMFPCRTLTIIMAFPGMGMVVAKFTKDVVSVQETAHETATANQGSNCVIVDELVRSGMSINGTSTEGPWQHGDK
jgi:hypothetical protein